MKKIIFLLSLCFTLTACSNKPAVQANTTPSLQELRAEYTMKLTGNGVDIKHTGNTYVFIIPTRLLFFTNSANFNLNAKDMLLTVAKFIRSYRTVSIRVGAFSGEFHSNEVQTALATLQANNVLNALWKVGLDARLVYSEGFNHQENSNGKPCVEIKFKVYPYPYSL